MNDEYSKSSNGDKKDNHKCLNCGSPIVATDEYCAVCGQKNIDGRITFRQFVSDFFEAAFNLDSRLIKTIPALLVPGKLTRVYFSGKHNAYFKPLRLFFTAMIVFYAVLGFKYLNKLEDRLGQDNPAQLYAHAQFIDTVIAHIGYDTLTVDQQNVVDTIVSAVHAPFDAVVLNEQLNENTDQQIIWLGDTTDVSMRDIYTMSVDSIFKKYKIEGFVNRLAIRQTIVVTRHPGKMIRFIIGNTTWMIIIMLPVVAGFMQLVYIRRKTFFIEHLIFLYHYHAAAFFVMTVYLFILPALSTLLAWLIPLALAVFFLSAMKVYYRQNWLKTILKFGIIGMVYVFLFSVFGVLTSVVSFFMYQ